MKRTVAKTMTAIMLIVCLLSMMIGCQGNTPAASSETKTEGANATATQPPKEEQPQASTEEKVMKVAVPSVPTTYNPFSSKAGSNYNIYGKTQVYDTLFVHDADGNIVPSIVESYDITSDNLNITLKLHKGVKFSNGKEFTAEDAKFSLEKAREVSITAVYFECIEDIEIVGDYTIILHLNSVNAPLFENMTLYGQMVCKSAYEELGDDYGMTAENTIGTGPYAVAEFIPEQHVTYVANENYFKGAPNVKKIEVQTIVNEESSLIALQTGEFDYYMRSAPAIAIPTIEADPNLQLVNIVSKKMYYMCFNCEHGPFADPNMRKAVSLAINRDDLNVIITEGLGTIVYYPGYPTNTGNPDINAEVAYQQNVEEARRLIKEAGYEGKTITASLENDTVLQQFATAVQDQLREVGLTLEINMMEYSTFMDDVFSQGNYELTVSFNTAKSFDMDMVWTNCLYSEKVGSGNTARYVNKDMDELIIKARTEMDPEARKNAYKECIQLYLEDLPLLPICYEYSSRVYNKSRLSIDEGLVAQDNFYYFSWTN